jgi:hypothetical protein
LNRKIIVFVSVALLALFVGWFLTTHERVTKTTHSGYRGEARINRFLAATLLINEVGIEAESLDTLEPLDWLPEYGDTIFTRLSANLAVGDQRQALEDWVASGGHLVIMPSNEQIRIVDDMLLSLGFSLVDVELPTEEEDAEESDVEEMDDDYDYTVDLNLISQRLEVSHDAVESTTLTDDNGVVAARRTFGNGYVTVIVDSVIFSNRHLDELDHGRLLLDIVFGYTESDKVWLVYDASFTPFWKLIWNNAPYAVAGSLALLVIAMWAAMPVFGPSIQADPPIRRSIIEHIRAAGTFVWKQHGATNLGDSVAKAVLYRAEARHPGIGRLAPAAQAQLIARLTGLDPQVILDAILSSAEPHTREFTQHMEILQQIRKEL